MSKGKARAPQEMFTPGSRDDNDPQYLERTTTTEDHAEWLRNVQGALDRSRGVTDKQGRSYRVELYTTWDKSAIAAIARGMKERALRGRELVLLKHFWNRLCETTEELLERIGE